MKKLIVAAAIVCAAVITQAASVSWTCKEVMNSTGAEASGLAFFVNAATLDRADALALAGKGASAISSALEGFYSYMGSEGTFSVGKSDAVANATLGLKDGQDQNAYLIIFDTATITDSSKFFVTETKNVLTLTGADDVASIKWGSQLEATTASGVWGSASSVPEPTSGLLLLLGMAGLALKRKRA